tara:strand:- start:480 stop:2237 length:1758 start_codon:yes stop_codon:yes gene_type:complete
MAYYYGQNKVGASSVSMKDLYRMKSMNLNTDKTDNFHLSPYSTGSSGTGSFDNNYSVAIGYEVNPFQSQKLSGIDSRTGGMVQFNDPNGYFSGGTYTHQVSLGTIREMDKYYTPYTWGSFTPTFTSLNTMFDGAYSLGHNGAYRWSFSIYSMNRDNQNGIFEQANWIFSCRRSNGAFRIMVGNIKLDQLGNITVFGNTTSSDISSTINGQTIPLFPGHGQGDHGVISGNGKTGASTQLALIYRNGSALERYRIITVNEDVTSTSTTPSLSVGAERTLASNGSPVIVSGQNMGSGTAWAPMYRGANYARVGYVNWSSGTTADTNGNAFIFTQSSTTTMQVGQTVKISDELLLWFFPRRNGQSSGNSRAISATAVYANGVNKVPTLRGGSSYLDTYDFGSASNICIGALGGSSNDKDVVSGIVYWNRSNTSVLYIMPWTYVISTNVLDFKTADILELTSVNDGNSYRMVPSGFCMGYNEDVEANYFQVVNSTVSGDYVLTIQQNAQISSGNYSTTLKNTRTPSQGFGTGVNRSQCSIYSNGMRNSQRHWFNDATPVTFAGYTGNLSGVAAVVDGSTFKIGMINYDVS